MAQGPELRRSIQRAAQDARLRLQLLSQDEDLGLMPTSLLTISVMLPQLLNCRIDVRTECLVHSFYSTLQMNVLGIVCTPQIRYNPFNQSIMVDPYNLIPSVLGVRSMLHKISIKGKNSKMNYNRSH